MVIGIRQAVNDMGRKDGSEQAEDDEEMTEDQEVSNRQMKSDGNQ